jgi:hypothetical protein
MFNFLRRKPKHQIPPGSDEKHIIVFEAARVAIYDWPQKGTMMYKEFHGHGDQGQQQARFEVAAYLLHAISFWCQVGHGRDNPKCATVPDAFFELLQRRDWFGTLCTSRELGILLSDRDHAYYEAYKDGEAVRSLQLLTAVLGYALKGGRGLTIFHGGKPFDAKEVVVEALTDGVHLGPMIEGIEMPSYFLGINKLVTDALQKCYMSLQL